jgi:hypothetical protein
MWALAPAWGALGEAGVEEQLLLEPVWIKLEEVRKFLEVLAGEEPFDGLDLPQYRRFSLGVPFDRRRVRSVPDHLPQNGREERLWPA